MANKEKFVLKKIYRGDYRAVDNQIIRWRKRGGQDQIVTQKKLKKDRIARLNQALYAHKGPIKHEEQVVRGDSATEQSELVNRLLNVNFFEPENN